MDIYFFSNISDFASETISFLFKANLPNSNHQSVNQAPTQNVIGQASRGAEERIPSRNTLAQNQQNLTRQQKRAQNKKMKRNSSGKFKKY